VRVRYSRGTNEECAECVLEPDDLRELVLEAIQRQDPTVLTVELLDAG
jgi:hypothetical protein